MIFCKNACKVEKMERELNRIKNEPTVNLINEKLNIGNPWNPAGSASYDAITNQIKISSGSLFNVDIAIQPSQAHTLISILDRFDFKFKNQQGIIDGLNRAIKEDYIPKKKKQKKTKKGA